ncbi:MAG: four helix bundle protein [Armatimonadota bacterium]|nr:four helix bundle protein [Armatimonadota bacterium]
MINSYKDLRVWEAGIDLSLAVYQATRLFPKQEWFGLVAQMRRSAASVPANIAEGAWRQHTGELIQFLHIARGSLAELHTYVTMSARLEYLTAEVSQSLNDKIDDMGRMLHGLISSLREKRGSGHESRTTNH